MNNQDSLEKQTNFKRSKGIKVVSLPKSPLSQQPPNSPSNLSHRQFLQKNNTKNHPQSHYLPISDQNYSFILDYQNARYHGKVSSIQNSTTKKLIKTGPGVLLDDQLSFLVSNWKNNFPDGQTVLIDRVGNYLYGKFKQSSGSPAGLVIFKVGPVLLLTKFSQKTGKWNMTETDKENIMIAIDQQALSLVVLKGNLQEVSGELKCKKSSPLSVVQFVHFASPFCEQVKKQSGQYQTGSNHKSKTSQTRQKLKVQQILLTYAEKYGFKVQSYEVSISNYLESIASSVKKECLSSKQFSYEVTKSLLNQVFSSSEYQSKQRKQNYESYEKEKHKIYDKYFLTFTECPSDSSKINKIKETSFYFGFLNGLGIRFKVQQLLPVKTNSAQKMKSFRLKSVGIHNEKIKVEEIGAKFYDNNCIQEGNFRTKNTCTYQNPLFRPTNKLLSIYNKFHKQQTTFINEYFDRNQISIFKLLSSFEQFVSEHVAYILNECLIETTKFNEKSEKDELVEKVLLKNYKKSMPVSRTVFDQNLRRPSHELQFQKRKQSRKDENVKNEALNELKEKKSELKEKIKKVKYEMEYLADGKDNVVTVNDDKLMSKIKKHLALYEGGEDEKNKGSKIDGQGKNEDRSRSKLVVGSKSKSKKGYIQKDKPKGVSPEKNHNSSRTGKKKTNQESKRGLINDMKTRQKSDYCAKTDQVILARINQSIEFRQKFNYGIEYNVDSNFVHKQSEARKSSRSPTKNIYNGRNRFFTDTQLDSAVDHHLSSSSQVSVKSITPGKKNKKKSQYRHMIYSNTRRNQTQDDLTYENQKITEESIRAQILGLTLEEYRKNIHFQKQQHQFMELNFLKLIEEEQSLLKSSIRRISQEIQDFHDPNQTFGVYANQSVKFSPTKKYKQENQKRMRNMENQSRERQIRQMAESQARERHKNLSGLGENQKIGEFSEYKKNAYEDVSYCPKPTRQQSLIEKRLRILQDYKELNGRENEKEELAYIPLYNNNLKLRNGEGPSFREVTPGDLKRQKQYENLPVYKEKAESRILSPLKVMIENRENGEIEGCGKWSEMGLEKSRREKRKEKDREIVEKVESLRKGVIKGQNQIKGVDNARKSLNRTYQYYFQ